MQVVLGQALHQVDELLPSSSLPFDDIAAAVLLVFFGVRTLQVTSLLLASHLYSGMPCSLFCCNHCQSWPCNHCHSNAPTAVLFNVNVTGHFRAPAWKSLSMLVHGAVLYGSKYCVTTKGTTVDNRSRLQMMQGTGNRVSAKVNTLLLTDECRKLGKQIQVPWMRREKHRRKLSAWTQVCSCTTIMLVHCCLRCTKLPHVVLQYHFMLHCCS